jgi:hypothetical protein
MIEGALVRVPFLLKVRYVPTDSAKKAVDIFPRTGIPK